MQIRRARKCVKKNWTALQSTRKVSILFDDYSTIVSKARFKATHEKGLKIVIPKQMFQRLQIALVQVKSGNTSESLLNEIRQVIYSLY